MLSQDGKTVLVLVFLVAIFQVASLPKSIYISFFFISNYMSD